MQKVRNYIKNEWKTYEIVLFVIMCLMFFNVMCINVFKLDDFLNSDIVAEMSYVKTVCEQKSLIPFDWVNSQELFINRPVYISAPLYLITENLFLSYKITIVITTILIIITLGYFLKQVGIRRKNILLAIICLLGLFCNEITRTIFIFLNAYALFPVAIFITFGYYIKNNIKHEEIRGFVIKSILIYVLAFIMGISGPRMAIVLYLPIVGIEFFESMLRTWKNKKISVEVHTIYNGLGLLVINCTGFLTYKIFIKNAIEHNDISNFQVLDIKQIISNIPNLLAAMLNAIGIYGNVDLLSLKGIDFIAKGLLLIIVILLGFYITKKSDEVIKKIMLFFGSSLMLVGIYTLLTSDVFSERYYFMILFLVVTIIAISMQKLEKTNKIFEVLISSILFIMVMVNLKANFIPLYKTEGNQIQKQIANYLIENDYKRAYATYWNADILKGLTNAQVETGHFTGEGFNPYLWLTNKSLYSEQKEFIKTAIVLTDQEENAILALDNYDSVVLQHMDKVAKIQEYNIYHTENNPAVQAVLPRKNGECIFYDFTKRYAQRDDAIVKVNYEEKYIEADSIGGFLVWGPGTNTHTGTYSFKLNYKIIQSIGDDVGYFEVALNGGSIQKAVKNIESGNTSITIDNVTFENNTDTVEYRIWTQPGVTIQLQSIEIVKVG